MMDFDPLAVVLGELFVPWPCWMKPKFSQMYPTSDEFFWSFLMMEEGFSLYYPGHFAETNENTTVLLHLLKEETTPEDYVQVGFVLRPSEELFRRLDNRLLEPFRRVFKASDTGSVDVSIQMCIHGKIAHFVNRRQTL